MFWEADWHCFIAFLGLPSFIPIHGSLVVYQSAVRNTQFTIKTGIECVCESRQLIVVSPSVDIIRTHHDLKLYPISHRTILHCHSDP